MGYKASDMGDAANELSKTQNTDYLCSPILPFVPGVVFKNGKVYFQNIMSLWNWPLTLWIQNLIKSSLLSYLTLVWQYVTMNPQNDEFLSYYSHLVSTVGQTWPLTSAHKNPYPFICGVYKFEEIPTKRSLYPVFTRMAQTEFYNDLDL